MQILKRLERQDICPQLNVAGSYGSWSSLAWSPDARHLAVVSDDQEMAGGALSLAVLSFA